MVPHLREAFLKNSAFRNKTQRALSHTNWGKKCRFSAHRCSEFGNSPKPEEFFLRKTAAPKDRTYQPNCEGANVNHSRVSRTATSIVYSTSIPGNPPTTRNSSWLNSLPCWWTGTAFETVMKSKVMDTTNCQICLRTKFRTRVCSWVTYAFKLTVKLKSRLIL
jgi:hypothetical protein